MEATATAEAAEAMEETETPTQSFLPGLEDLSNRHRDKVAINAEPILNLLTEQVLANLSIDPSNLRWFVERYVRHCDNWNKISQFKINCTIPVGCGFSDNCSIGTVCREERPDGTFQCTPSG
jgi:hypothetical protein